MALAVWLLAAGVSRAERLAVTAPKANSSYFLCFPQPHPRRTE
jgi:hypothetical protein